MSAAPVIRIVNARQHNLKGVTVDLPHRALIVVTGPSGSGKSSLAFDTIYAEGQRRYIESLSTYAKQFLDRMPKPLVDRLEGLAPAVAIEQRNPTVSSRSTVGTATEVYDYLRLLWSRLGRAHCLRCDAVIRRDTPQFAADEVVARMSGRIQVTFPLPLSARHSHEAIVENLRALGFVRVLEHGRLGGSAARRLDELPPGTDLAGAEELLVVVDRLTAERDQASRIAEAVATAFTEGEGVAVVVHETGSMRFTEHPACSSCDAPGPSVTPVLFSFNSPRGACATCNGFGATLEYHESLIVPDPSRSIRDGAIDPWTKPRYEARRQLVVDTAKKLGADPDAPWRKLTAAVRRELLHGKKGKYVGIFPFLRGLEEKRYKQYVRVFLRQYQLALPCPDCGGTRLNDDARSVRFHGHNIAEIGALSVDGIHEWLGRLDLTAQERAVGELIFDQLGSRLEFLRDVGLGYLTLERQTRTLSGGEAQRIALSNALGARLVDTLYVLDEPSIGLHPRDTERLLGLLRRLRDGGNTVIVVEHDLAAIEQADFMVELGAGAGEHGGEVVFAGWLKEAGEGGRGRAWAAGSVAPAAVSPAHARPCPPMPALSQTLTGQYLTGRKRIGVPSERRDAGPHWISIRGASLHNLQNVDADIPLGTLTAVTGVSGSGKSTLVHDVLYRQLEARLHGEHTAKSHLGEAVGQVQKLAGAERIEDVVLIDQSPIGRSPRSNPVTYIKAFDEIRELFADQPLAKARKYSAATFSFNMPGGRCEACEGAGHVQVEMVFLADVYVPCDICGGTRYKPEVLDVRIQGKSIHDVLQWTVTEALARFRHQPKLGTALWHLQQVGLGYLRLGQPATTLSGGEAQRLKIARELVRGARSKAGGRAKAGEGGRGRAGPGRRLYILDEPTTGLHLEDVRVLLQVLDRLVDAGHTVLVIEHHLDVIKRADWVIDLGPGAGPQGGLVVAQGRPEEIAATEASHTGRWLRAVLAAGTLTAAG